ncbi:hypothetical protein B0J13DRAFT_672100 [Dactylonectria estremocensis]|uniref:Myb-like DNA-binding domain-containing protein n=1 Tax=Dactylonectria estremocensis TaxID=1079267 RepID=A0A9P9F570_9HYPO|nr:hypothetical protein B0J13DRAFT_672100 [Dactylonectria estremocensis]
MSKQEPADQVKFLVACIGHTTNGRPDFQAVADDLSIVSKAAAQKRYERMLKSHGIKPGKANAAAKEESTNGNTNGEKASPSKRKAKAPNASASPAKRTRACRIPKKESDDDEKPLAKGDTKQEGQDSPTSPASSLSDAPASDKEEA